MQKRTSQNKLRGSKYCSFHLVANMSEEMCFEWREDEIMLKIMLLSLDFLKRCVGNPNIFFEIFTYIFLCSCSCRRWGTHKHNNLRYVSKLDFFPFKFFLLWMFVLSFCKILKFYRFLRILWSLAEARVFSSASREARKFQ
jgi:hypothetical protein